MLNFRRFGVGFRVSGFGGFKGGAGCVRAAFSKVHRMEGFDPAGRCLSSACGRDRSAGFEP